MKKLGENPNPSGSGAMLAMVKGVGLVLTAPYRACLCCSAREKPGAHVVQSGNLAPHANGATNAGDGQRRANSRAAISHGRGAGCDAGAGCGCSLCAGRGASRGGSICQYCGANSAGGGACAIVGGRSLYT
jgi:hypothetical protein